MGLRLSATGLYAGLADLFARGDARGLLHTRPLGKAITLADDVAITDTNDHDYNTNMTSGNADCLDGRGCVIGVENTHDQAFTISVYGHYEDGTDMVLAYTEASNIADGSGTKQYLLIAPGTAATGASGYKSVPCLGDGLFGVTVRATAAGVPTSGALRIIVYAT